MRQVLQARSGATVVRDVPAPACPPGGALVRNHFSVISSGTERTRVAQAQKSLLGKARERPELVREVVGRALREGVLETGEGVRRKLSEETAVGYASAGVVLEVGTRVRGLDPGDAVACAGGGYANHAEIVSVPANLCARVPEGVPLECAAFATVAAIALHGIRLAEVELGERVGVIGCGLLGQIACRLLRAAGAWTVAIDIDPSRAEQAVRGGADRGFPVGASVEERVRQATGGLGLDRVLVTAASSTSDPLLLAANIARDRGTLVVVGDVPVDLPRAPLYLKELVLRVSRSYGPGRYDADYEERGLDYPPGYVRWTEGRNLEGVLDLLARGRLDLSDLVDDVVPVDDAARAYERLVGPPERRPRGAILLSYSERRRDGAAREALALEYPEVPATGIRRTGIGSRSVRIGLIGPGGFASRVLVPALVQAGARLELAGGGAGPSAEAATRALGFARSAASELAVLEDDEVDAVVVATRHGSHAELVTRALAAGKHVFCEKPLVLTREELDAVLEAAGRTPGILAVGFNRRFSPPLRAARDFVAASGSPLTAAYRVSAGHIPAEGWVHDLEQGGGRALGEVCHFVDSLAFLSGSEVRSVYALGHALDLPLQARDNLVVCLEHANGSVGTILYAAEGGPGVPKERVEVFAAGRTAIVDDFRSLELFSADVKQPRRSRGQEKGHRQEVRAFVDGVRSGEPPVPLAEIVNVSLATLAIVDSLRTGARVRLSSAPETG